MATPPDYHVPALEKGLDLLEALAAVAIPQSLTDLAARLERSPSALFRILNCLERRAFVTRDPLSGRYLLSYKLYALAHTHSPVEALRRAARRPMQRLGEAIRESCHLSVLDRDRLLVVEQFESPEPVRLSIEVGGRFDPVVTASGRLLLASLPEAELTAALERSPVGQKWSARRQRKFRDDLAVLGAQGSADAQDETIEGVDDFTVRVGCREQGLEAALAVTRFRRRGPSVSAGDIRRRLRAAAEEINAQLGILL